MITNTQLITEGLAMQLVPMALMGIGGGISGIGSLLGTDTLRDLFGTSASTINNLKDTGLAISSAGMASRLASTIDTMKTMVNRQQAMNQQTPQVDPNKPQYTPNSNTQIPKIDSTNTQQSIPIETKHNFINNR